MIAFRSVLDLVSFAEVDAKKPVAVLERKPNVVLRGTRFDRLSRVQSTSLATEFVGDRLTSAFFTFTWLS